MKHLSLFFSALFFSGAVMAKDGIKFDPSIAVDWNVMSTAQFPSKPIETQIIFTGKKDSVQTTDHYGNANGKAPAKENHDFIGITPDGDDYRITVNHERTDRNNETGDGGGMTTFKVERNSEGTFNVVETEMPDGRKGDFHNVDFENTVGTTWTNCGGIISPEGRIWTAEEYPFTKSQGNNSAKSFLRDTGDIVIGSGKLVHFLNDSAQVLTGNTLKAYENQGWMVEIDPRSGKAVRKQYNWGRMSFEAGCIMPDNKTVYLTEDLRPGMFTKFVADKAGDFTEGSLFVYDQKDTHGADGHWLKMNNSEIAEMVELSDSAYKKGATMFIRLEWVTEINGKVYICETGYDNVCKDKNWISRHNIGGEYATHHQARATAQSALLDTTGSAGAKPYADYYGRVLQYDPTTEEMSVYLEGGPEYSEKQSQAIADYPAVHLSNPDGLGKVTINGQIYMLINEDLNGSSYNRLPLEAASLNLCDMYMLDMSIQNPTLNDLIRIAVGPKTAELTGGNGTQDGKTIVVDIQHPNSSNDAPFNHATTIAMVGWDKLTEISKSTVGIDIDWDGSSKFQSTNNPAIKTQVLFSGTIDSVTVVDGYGKPNGIAPAKENHDFIGITPDNGGYLFSINHERTDRNELVGDGGGMTTFKAVYDGDSLKVVETELPDGRKGKFHNVDFANTVGVTWTNCGGIIAPDGRIWTAEEYPYTKSQGNQAAMRFLSDTADVIIGDGVLYPFNNDSAPVLAGEVLKAYESQGWMVEIDPFTGKAIRKQYNWGRMSFEAGCMMPDNKTVYLAEDLRPGMFTKFVADKAGDFTTGNLYVYDQKDTHGADGHWIKMDNSKIAEMVELSDSAYKRGATMFIRLEWVTEVNGKVYICETGYDNVCKDKNWVNRHNIGGEYATHHQARATAQGALLDTTGVGGKPYADYYGRVLQFDPATEEMSVYLEGGPEYSEKQSQAVADYPAKHLSNPDGLGKITVHNKTYLIINEDLNGSSYNRLPLESANAGSNACEMYLLDMTITNPTIDDLARIMVGPKGAELTGGNGTPDGKTILVDIQHPSSSNDEAYSIACTVALHGWDNIPENITEIATDNNTSFINSVDYVTKTVFFDNNYSVEVYNLLGKKVLARNMTNRINMYNLPVGAYIIRTSTGNTAKILNQ